MKIPQLRKKPEVKSCHNITWEDNYSWIHQSNILEVLKDKKKLNPEVEEYLNQENEYKQLIDHLMQQKVEGVVIGINGYGSRKIVPVLKKVIQRVYIVVHLIEEKSTSVICSSCGFRRIKKGKFIKCHRCKEVIHRDTNAAINILKRFEKGNWGSHDDPVLRRKRRKFKKNNS